MRAAILIGLVALALIPAASLVQAGVPVASTSTLWVDPDTSTVGDTVDVYIIVRDVYGEPIADITCDFISDRADSDLVIGSPDVTDVDGLAQARVSRDVNFSPSTPRASHITVDCDGVLIGPVTVVWFCLAGVDPGSSGGMALYGGAPNPFRTRTQISYAVAARGQVNLGIYDITGRKVRTLATGTVEPGDHVVAWDGTDELGREAAAGVYYVAMAAPGFAGTRNIILLR